MIRLEHFTQDDFDHLKEWVASKQLMHEWSGSLFSYPLTDDALEWYIEDANAPRSDVFIYKAVDLKTGEALGHVSLGSISKRDRSARLTRVLVGDAARGRGVCTQMIRAALRIGFEELHLHRISLGVYTFNHSAIRCYLRSGFHKEGVMRDVVRHGDEYWSLVEMSILEDEWRAQHPVAPPVSPSPAPTAPTAPTAPSALPPAPPQRGG